jgi:SAM-dependent methyltransferase
MAEELRSMDFKGKKAAQFCCNNGREILSLMQLVACIILDIDEMYHNSFDFIMFTIEAITWFEDMNPLFQKTEACLKPGGVSLLIKSLR